MQQFNSFITEKFDENVFKLSHDDHIKLVELDHRYGELFINFKYNMELNDIENYKEEWEKFSAAREKKKKYFPKLKFPVKNILKDEWFEDAEKLLNEFKKFDCYLSKYYIQNIQRLIITGKFNLDKSEENTKAINKLLCVKPSPEIYKAALTLLKRHPWKNKRSEQPFTGPQVVKELQKHIDKLKLDFKAVVDPYMIPRMGVRGERKKLTIRKDAHFSEIDLGSLKVHEVEVHCARRDAGIKQGLFLMLFGMPYANELDEGMAIFNSINYNPKGLKPNLFWDIAIKVIIGYNINKDFCEIYDIIYDLCEADETKGLDENLFRNLIRTKRMLGDCALPGGNTREEMDYFTGYTMVKGLSKEMKKDLVQYNIGAEQIPELNNIKAFFRVNKFDKIDPESIKIKKWTKREDW